MGKALCNVHMTFPTITRDGNDRSLMSLFLSLLQKNKGEYDSKPNCLKARQCSIYNYVAHFVDVKYTTRVYNCDEGDRNVNLRLN